VQKILTAGAVMGRRFSLRVMEALELVSTDDLFDILEEAEAAQLIHAASAGRDTVHRFSHELIRQTLVGALSIPKRQRLHLKISEAMERVYPDQLEDRAADYGYHLYQAGAAVDEHKAVRFLTIAGDQALDGAAWEEALVHFERALSIDEEVDPKQHVQLLLKKGSALRGIGEWSEALRLWEQALPTFEDLGDTAAVVRICEDAGVLRAWNSQLPEVTALAQRGLEALGDEPTVARGRMLALQGLARSVGDDPESGLLLIREGIRLGENLDDQALLGYAQQFNAIALHNHARFFAEIESGEQAVKTLRAAGDLWNLAQLLSHLGWALAACGRLQDARGFSNEVRKLAGEFGHVGASMLDDMTTGTVEWFQTGDFDRFIKFGLHGREVWKPAGPWWMFGDVFAAMGMFCRGDWGHASEAVETTLRAQPENWWTGFLGGWAFVLRAYLGAEDALAVFGQRRDSLLKPGKAFLGGGKYFALFATEGLAVLNERDEAAGLYPAAREVVEGGVVVGIAGLGQRYLGIAATCGRRWEAAEEHFEMALKQAHEIPHRTDQPETRRWYAWMLLDRDQPGDKEKAHALLNEAIPMYKELRMPKHLELAEALLGRVTS
jgi:tetratricopeptide (TPR) repeat protein